MNLYNGANCKDHKVIAKVGIYYDAFSNTVISAVTNYVNSTSDKYNIVILMGVNDLAGDIDANEKADNYLIKINSLSRSDWKNHNIIFVSIPPVQNNNKYNIKPSNVNVFNQNVKNKINSANISNFKYCDINTGFSTDGIYESDGLHYNSKGYLNLYNQVVNKCL